MCSAPFGLSYDRCVCVSVSCMHVYLCVRLLDLLAFWFVAGAGGGGGGGGCSWFVFYLPTNAANKIYSQIDVRLAVNNTNKCKFCNVDQSPMRTHVHVSIISVCMDLFAVFWQVLFYTQITDTNKHQVSVCAYLPLKFKSHPKIVDDSNDQIWRRWWISSDFFDELHICFMHTQHTTLLLAHSLTFSSLANVMIFFFVNEHNEMRYIQNIGHFEKLPNFKHHFYLTFDLKFIIVSSSPKLEVIL